MERNRMSSHAAALAMAFTMLWGASAFADDRAPDDYGLTDLIARIGAANVPTGANITVGQIEVPSGSNYGPSQTQAQYAGIVFHEQSGPAGFTSHAQQVARRFYGNMGISKDINEVYLYEVNSWLGSAYLRSGTGNDPLTTPTNLKVFNHSWVGFATTNAQNNDALRRADFAARRDNILMVVGVNNEGGSNQPLLSHIYNGISVGILDGVHQSGNTLPGIDGPGRLKPEIVAEEVVTSYATPFVAGAVTLMTETARTTPTLGINPAAERGEVIKAVILAGAQKPAGWTNNPQISGANRGFTAQPIDNIYGVGWLDVNLAHLILTAGEQDGSPTVPTAQNISSAGWDYDALDNHQSRYYRFRVHDTADEVNVLMTWHRRVFSSHTNWSLGEMQLTLWRVDNNNQLHPLTGNAGLGIFAGGNVASDSPVDNIEHLHVTGLEPCNYVLEMTRTDDFGGAADWEVAIAWRMPEPPSCLPDLDAAADGQIDVFDLFVLLSAWGQCADACPSTCAADLTDDGLVDVFDLFVLLSSWGSCP